MFQMKIRRAISPWRVRSRTSCSSVRIRIITTTATQKHKASRWVGPQGRECCTQSAAISFLWQTRRCRLPNLPFPAPGQSNHGRLPQRLHRTHPAICTLAAKSRPSPLRLPSEHQAGPSSILSSGKMACPSPFPAPLSFHPVFSPCVQ